MTPLRELVVVQHVAREGAGLLAAVAAERGLALTTLRPFAGDHLPQKLSPHQILAVMGGPMGVADIGDPSFPWLEPLVALLRSALAEERPVLGFCLGVSTMQGVGRPVQRPASALARCGSEAAQGHDRQVGAGLAPLSTTLGPPVWQALSTPDGRPRHWL